MRIVFTFNMIHPQDGGLTDLPDSTIKTLSDVQPHILDSIQILNSAHVSDEVNRRIKRIKSDNDGRNTTDPCSSH